MNITEMVIDMKKCKRLFFLFICILLASLFITACQSNNTDKNNEALNEVLQTVNNETSSLPDSEIIRKDDFFEAVNLNNSEISNSVDITDYKDASLNPDCIATICLTGDLMCLAGQQFSACTDEGFDFSGTFCLINEYLKEHDLVIGNLETLISESNPLTKDMKTVNSAPFCNGPKEFLAAVSEAGFSALITANNHSLDAGTKGIDETLAVLDDFGILHTGTFYENSNENRYIIINKNGINIAVISFTELINQRSALPTERLNRVINCYDPDLAAEYIASARDDGADFVIVYNHWGSENTHDVHTYQRQHAAELAEAGADLIIGSHPHCLQEYEQLTTADGRSVLAFYSLGNLVSSMARDINNDTVLLSVTLRKTSDDKTKIENHSLKYCYVFSSLDGKKHVITPLDYAIENNIRTKECNASYERISNVFINN